MGACRVIACLLVLLACGAAQADESPWGIEAFGNKNSSSGWEKFGVGTMIHMRGKSKASIKGVSPKPPRLTEEKMTLIEVTADVVRIRRESRTDGGEWKTSERTRSRRKLDVKYDEIGAETITVDGKQLACKKIRAVNREDDKAKAVIWWVHATEGALKMKVEGRKTWSILVSKLKVTRKVGDKTYSCRELRFRAGKSETTMIMSPDIPGRLVSMTLTMKGNGLLATSTSELVAFVKK